MTDVAASERFGQKSFHALTNQLFGAVAEHALHLSVDHDNLTVPIHGDDGIGCGEKEGLVQILGPPALGDFALQRDIGFAPLRCPLLDTALQFAPGPIERFLGLLSRSDFLNNTSDP